MKFLWGVKIQRIKNKILNQDVRQDLKYKHYKKMTEMKDSVIWTCVICDWQFNTFQRVKVMLNGSLGLVFVPK
jgi:hypothetical protein